MQQDRKCSSYVQASNVGEFHVMEETRDGDFRCRCLCVCVRPLSFYVCCACVCCVFLFFCDHLFVGYRGRASSIVLPGTEIRRSNGQTCVDKSKCIEISLFDRSSFLFKASHRPLEKLKLLDFELEMAFFLLTMKVIDKVNRFSRTKLVTISLVW